MVCLYFLIASAVFCAEGSKVFEADDTFAVLPTDRQIYANLCGQSYGAGSVWIRSRQGHSPDNVLYYRPKKEHLTQGQGENFCYSEGICTFLDCLPRLVGDVTEGYVVDVIEGYAMGQSWQEVCAKRYQVPEADLTCAAVALIRKHFTGSLSSDGLLHPDFGSWARYSPQYDVCNSDKVICSKICEHKYGEGSIWIRREDGRFLLCYVSDFGPSWMCYRYDLAHENEWPKNWLDTLKILQKFMLLKTGNAETFFGSHYQNVVSVVKAVLSGRAARWDESLPFAWRPQCATSDPFLQENKRDAIQQGRAVDGVYCAESVWVTRMRGTYVCRMRFKDGRISQVAESTQKNQTYASWLVPCHINIVG